MLRLSIAVATVLLGAAALAGAADSPVGGEAYVSFSIPDSFSKSAAGEKTRAEVKAELKQARLQGQPAGGEEYVVFEPAKRKDAVLPREDAVAKTR